MTAYRQALRLLPALLLSLSPALLQAQCDSPVATLSSAEGRLELRRADAEIWTTALPDELLCPGDTLRIDRHSRGALTLADHTLVRLGASTTVTIDGPHDEKGFLLELLEGIGHFMSRVPRTLEVDTPFVNAGVEGTEFLVRVADDETFVSVYEGKVAMENGAGRLLLRQGQSGAAGEGVAPILRLVAKPKDAVQWSLYYPPLLSAAGAEEPLIREATRQAEESPSAALAVLEEATPLSTSALNYRAALRLAVGQPAQAREDIEQSLSQAPENGDALALLSLIAAVQGDKEEALRRAEAAIDSAPEALAPRLALSYALQSQFRLEESLAAIQEATALAPESVIAWARLAELQLMFRHLDQALDASEHAITLAPDNAHALTIRGFAQLIALDTEAATEDFQAAIESDPSVPLPRLGLGLALIRDGKLQQGRRAIEIATILDPGNALFRSYLGKAYYEEKRDGLAATQYGMAMEQDPQDPTAFFYNAILMQIDNRPIEALDSLQQAIEKNDNRAVYRSRLLLDGDQATRSTSAAGIYNTLGFEQLARNEADRSLSRDPANYSAHRFLADSYSNTPRHEVARASELLKSQLLQPLNHSPLQPHIAENDLFLIERSGAADAAYHEYHPLFVQDGITAQLSAMGGTQGTLSDEVLLSGTEGHYAYSLGQYHYESDGFRDNNDSQHDIYNAFGQVAITPKLSLQAEYRYRQSESGDLIMRFDPELFAPYERKEYERQTGRLGFHYQPAPSSHLIGSFVYRKRDDVLLDSVVDDLSDLAGLLPFDPVGTFFVTDYENTTSGVAKQTELQYLHSSAVYTATIGAGYIEENSDFERIKLETLVVPDDRLIPPPFPEPNVTNQAYAITSEEDSRYRNAYAYFNIMPRKDLVWTLGASYDRFEAVSGDTEKTHPKLGVSWQATPDTRLRAAWFKTTNHPYIANQTIEPTQIAGFNQFFDETAGTLTEHYGAALEQRLNRSISVGITGTHRELEAPRYGAITTPNIRKQTSYEAYLFWLLNRRVALSTRFIHEHLEQSLESPDELDTLRVPIGLSYFGNNGIYLTTVATYVDQDIDMTRTFSFKDNDQFWNIDASLGYKLPKRYGLLRLSVKNLLDEDFNYQDGSYGNPEMMAPLYLPERVVLCELRVTAF